MLAVTREKTNHGNGGIVHGVYSWGYGGGGRLGHGDKGGFLRPKRIDGLRDSAGDTHCIQVAAGESHSLALSSDGCLHSWGVGDYGKLGHGDLTHQ
eukprot:6261295-Prymnesium_polylepis.1